MNNSLDLSKLRGLIPESVIQELPLIVEKFKINTPLRMAHFLAQCSHESGNFKVKFENLNYSSNRLKQVFPKYFPGTLSEQYAGNPEKIGSRVYGGRLGNGPEATKEGFKFRGRGFIQITGKQNYIDLGLALNEDLVKSPDLVSTKYPLTSAAWFFSKYCLKKSDLGSNVDAITSVSKCVNGGTNGLQDRITKFGQFFKALS